MATYTWAQFKNEVKALLSDKAIDDSSGVLAVADWVKAKAARDLMGDLNQHNSLWASYQDRRRDLLGYTITLDDATLRSRVRELITDSSLVDTIAFRAIATFVKAHMSRDVFHDLPSYDLQMADWKSQRPRLLGYSVSVSGATLRAEINKQLTSSTVSDDTGVRGVAEYLRSKAARELFNDLNGYNSHWASYLDRRKELIGYTITLDDATLRTRVKELLTDITLGDTIAFRAIATFVKAHLSRDVYSDGTFEAQMADWRMQRPRLLGYTVSISGSTLRTEIDKLLTSATVSNDTGVRAVSEYVQAQASKTLFGDLNSYNVHMANYLQHRKELIGFTITLDDATLRTRVRELVTDTTIGETIAYRAVATFVKGHLNRDYFKDLVSAEVQLNDWKIQRPRLLGYTITTSGSTLRTEINKQLTDATASDVTAARAVTDYCLAKMARSLDNDQASHDAYWNSYLQHQRRLLGYTITLSDAALKTAVKKEITDVQPNDDTYVRGLADYTKAMAARDLIGNLEQFNSNFASYRNQRRKLVGYTTALSDAAVKTKVKELLTDTTATEATAVRAIADFVKSRILSEVDKDPEMAEAHNKKWIIQRMRLVGYTVTSDAATLRTEVNKLITVDANRQGITDFIDAQIAQAKFDIGYLDVFLDRTILQGKADVIAFNDFFDITLTQAKTDIAGLNTTIDTLITQATTEISGLALFINTNITQAKIDIAGINTQIDALIVQAVGEIGGLATFINTNISQAKIDIAGPNTTIEAYILQATTEIAGLATFINTQIAQAKADLAASATFLDKHIRHGVKELQEMIDFYRLNHETIYQTDDLADEGEASVGQLPEEAQLRDAYYVKVGSSVIRKPLANYNWGNRHDLIAGQPTIKSRAPFLMAVDPNAKTFIVFPAVLEGHYISLFWDGTKLEFTDTETVPFDEGCAKAVADYVQARRYLEPASLNMKLVAAHTANYLSQRRALYRLAGDKKRLRDTDLSPEQFGTGAVCDDNTDLVEWVMFGDSGESPLANTIAVAGLVNSIEPDFVLHLGDANYPDGDATLMQANILDHYSQWIRSEKWYQAWGNHDLAGIADGQYGKPLLNILPHISEISGGKLYYGFVVGNVGFFVINSGYTDGDPREPDGIIYGSVQSAAVEAWIAANDVDWKIAIFHRPAHSSDINHSPGSTAMQGWPLKTLGFHLAVGAHGHQYERLLVDGLPIINIGLGGAMKRDFGTVVAGSQFRYNTQYGVVKASASSTKLQTTFFGVNGQMLDQLTLVKEAE